MNRDEYQAKLADARTVITDATYKFCRGDGDPIRMRDVGQWEFLILHALDQINRVVTK